MATEKQAPQSLTAKTKKAVDLIRKSFTTFVKDFASLAEKREVLAPRFMKAYNSWAEETGGSFIDFVRYLVPDVPAQSRSNDKGPGYRDHRAYQAADYLRRRAQELKRKEDLAKQTPQQRQKQIASAAATPMYAAAKVLAALLAIVPPEEQDKIRAAMHDTLHWSDRQVERVMKLGLETQPLVVPRLPRGVHFPAMKLAVPATTEGEPLTAERVAQAS